MPTLSRWQFGIPKRPSRRRPSCPRPRGRLRNQRLRLHRRGGRSRAERERKDLPWSDRPKIRWKFQVRKKNFDKEIPEKLKTCNTVYNVSKYWQSWDGWSENSFKHQTKKCKNICSKTICLCLCLVCREIRSISVCFLFNNMSLSLCLSDSLSLCLSVSLSLCLSVSPSLCLSVSTRQR